MKIRESETSKDPQPQPPLLLSFLSLRFGSRVIFMFIDDGMLIVCKAHVCVKLCEKM